MKKSNILILISVIAVLSVNLYGSKWRVEEQLVSARQLISIHNNEPVIRIKDQQLKPSLVKVVKGDFESLLQIKDPAYSLSVDGEKDSNGVTLTSPVINPLFLKQQEEKDRWEVKVKGLRQVYLNDRLIWSLDSMNCETVDSTGHE